MPDLVYGRHPVLEALRAGETVERVLVAKGTQTAGPLADILKLAQQRGVRVVWVERRELDRLGGVHQGVAAEIRAFQYAEVEDILAFRFEDFRLEGYDPHPHIAAPVAV